MERPPRRLAPGNVEDFLHAIAVLLHDAQRAGKDLRIAQVIGNLGDCYHMEDADYVNHVWEACD